VNSGVQRSCVVAIRGADIIRAENGNENSELAAIDKKVDGGEKRSRIDGDARGGRNSEEQRDGVGKGGIKSRLRVKKVERAKIRWSRGRSGRRKDGKHTRGEERSSRRGRRRTGKERTELVGGKKDITVGVVVGKEVGAGGRAESSEVGGGKGFEVGSGERSGRRRRARPRSRKEGTIGSRSGGRSRGKGGRRSEEGLRESEPKIERMAEGRNARVDGCRMDGRAESKIAKAGWASRRVSGDNSSDGIAFGIAETKTNEVMDAEEGGADRRTDSSGLQSSVIRAAGNVAKSRDEFGRTKK
jgi:hypothetical protein